MAEKKNKDLKNSWRANTVFREATTMLRADFILLKIKSCKFFNVIFIITLLIAVNLGLYGYQNIIEIQIQHSHFEKNLREIQEVQCYNL